MFWFLAEPASSGTYTFQVQQTYSDGSIVDWTGSESSENPAPTIEVSSSVGGGTSTLTIVALVVGAIGVILGAVALVARGGGRGGWRDAPGAESSSRARRGGGAGAAGRGVRARVPDKTFPSASAILDTPPPSVP